MSREGERFAQEVAAVGNRRDLDSFQQFFLCFLAEAFQIQQPVVLARSLQIPDALNTKVFIESPNFLGAQVGDAEELE